MPLQSELVGRQWQKDFKAAEMAQLRKHLPHWLEAGFWISKVHKSQVGKVAALTALSVSSARDAASKSKILTGSDSYRS